MLTIDKHIFNYLKPFSAAAYIGCLMLCSCAMSSQQIDNNSLFKECIESINSGSASSQRAFAQKHILKNEDEDVVQAWINYLDKVRADYGKLTWVRAGHSSPAKRTFICKASKGKGSRQWMMVTMSFDSTQTEKLIGSRSDWSFDPRVIIPQGKLSATQIKGLMEDYIAVMQKSNDFSGTAILAHNDIVLVKAFGGYADKENNLHININTKLNLASTTKMFTSVAIAQLVQANKLNFNTHLIDVIPDFPNRDAAEKITIHQLLTHSSGLGDYWRIFDRSDREKIITLQAYFDLVKRDKLLFEPGTDVQYSNVGVLVLGLVIEKLSGIDYYSYVNKHVFGPAGMTSTRFYSLHNLPDNLAQGYYGSPGNRKSNHPERYLGKPVIGSSAGGCYSTVYDMLRFEKALFDGTLIDEELVETITSPKIELSRDLDYGYLFHCPLINGHRYIGHDGGSPGINSEFRMFRDDKYTLVVLSNVDSGADELGEFVTSLIVQE